MKIATWNVNGLRARLDFLLHSIAFAPREAIAGDFLEGISREAFRQAHDISAYSFAALAKAALPLLTRNSSLLTLTYLGAIRVVPNYNTMGLAKASLEASVRYLAASLGPQGIRAAGVTPWGPVNDAGLGYMSELVMGTVHSGAHHFSALYSRSKSTIV